MARLTPEQLKIKLNFIDNYITAANAAHGSTFDPNANIRAKNVATLSAEVNKDINIQLNRAMIVRELDDYFGSSLVSDTYIKQLEDHLIYCHDESCSLSPTYCAAVSLYPYLENGLQLVGGDSRAPQHLSSFTGGYGNLLYALSSQFKGAIATVSFLACFDLFARRDYGDDYLSTHTSIIEQELQQVVYEMNQPSAARNYQAVFSNWSIFDKYYFDAILGNIVLPDGSKFKWETVDRLQRFFMHWFNIERTKALLTFPVITACLLTDGYKPKDTETVDFLCEELAAGNSFFIFMSNKAESLSSCCRLESNIADQLNDFQYSLGTGGLMTGSINVLTLNMNRFTQDVYKTNGDNFEDCLYEQIKLMHKFQMGHRKHVEHFIEQGVMPAYDAHFIDVNKQYVTIGLNGLVEAAEYLGYSISKNKDYMNFLSRVFKVISKANQESKKYYNIKINTELVPAEGLGVKFAAWDKKDGYWVPRDCYNSYLYKVEDDEISVLDKFALHGKNACDYLDGGSALHVNCEDYPTKLTFKRLLDVAASEGCKYFCFNIKVTICNECKYINKHTLNYCSKCGSTNVDYATRVIGYLTRVSCYSAGRQEEEKVRAYARLR